MKKSDLMTGQVVVTREDKYVVLKDANIIVSDNGWLPLGKYHDDLVFGVYSFDGRQKKFDIMSVYDTPSYKIDYINNSTKNRNVIWERKLSIEIDVRINGEKANLSDLSEETILKLREEN